ncbi:LysM peptidoglycan-binding domain-containing protein [Sinomonas humi]|uniref:LysM peptidoglycan-binding domain-containing protein n=1 Tax=Sinomonas humi TaxID=1338436 RepID=UPI00068E8AFF|nr:LysM peptidoglycan-binding domain-containing protein [Sinomonas humi]
MNKGRRLRATTVTASAAALTAAIAAPAAAAADSYTVRPGDTLSGIAARTGVPLDTLFQLNGLGWSSIIYPGQQIRLGDGSASGASTASSPAPIAAASAPQTYTVKSGDTLWGISQQSGVSLSDLYRLNGLGSTSTIYPGQRIVLHAAAAAPAAAPSAAAPASSSAAPAASNVKAAVAPPPAWSSSMWNETTARQKTMYGVQEKTGIPLGTLMAKGGGSTASGTETVAQIQSMVRQIATSMGVPTALALAIAEQESGFRQNVTSSVGAIGVMQIMPANASWLSSLAGRTLDLRNTTDNITAGVAMLRWLLKNAASQDIAIAGYYQGLYGVQAYGMYPDTKAYVAQVKARMAKYS